MTRRRHLMLPQPLTWFRNLIECLGEHLTIHLASLDGHPLASILTLSFKNTVVYKYGCSDARHHRLGGMPFLFWRVIQRAANEGKQEFDLGRSDLDQPGLIRFKDRLGASRSDVTYYRYPAKHTPPVRDMWKQQAARRIVAHLPDPALTLAGRLLYKHFA
jgi:lipid II:glycine glycyltransferase (peptidoglycan interpeptide bridge formation enzyme)